MASDEFKTEPNNDSKYIGIRVTGPKPDSSIAAEIVKATATAMRFPWEQAISETDWIY